MQVQTFMLELKTPTCTAHDNTHGMQKYTVIEWPQNGFREFGEKEEWSVTSDGDDAARWPY